MASYLKSSNLQLFTRFRNLKLRQTPGNGSSADLTSPGQLHIVGRTSGMRLDVRGISSSVASRADEKASKASSGGATLPTAAGMSGAEDTFAFRHRRVVSSFLCYGTPHTAGFRVSTFKRSNKVRTYPGKWAACSGSVESTDVSPVRAALRELLEETGLAETRLVRVGGGGGPIDEHGEESFGEGSVNYVLRDEYLRTVWEVWPFLWRVLAEGEKKELDLEEIETSICLDWEHDEMRFVTLEEMKQMDTVEDLGRGVRTVLASLDK
jgi:8-oxo-dGTP pyrophosphatase MutT (NUDIX family)